MKTHVLRPSFRRLYVGLAIMLLTGLGLSFALYFGMGGSLLSAIPGALAVLIAVPLAIFALFTTYSHSYVFSEQEITVNQGVINRISRSVPVANVDNIAVQRNLVDLLLGVGSISIDTPGGTGYELVIKHVEINLLKEVVEELKAHMEERQGGVKRNL